METVIDRTEVENFIIGMRGYLTSVRFTRGTFFVNGYIDGKSLCDANSASGNGETLAEAMREFDAAYDAALNAKPVLNTASECKAAVIDLIIEHNAAPEAFRDAVESLKVSGA